MELTADFATVRGRKKRHSYERVPRQSLNQFGEVKSLKLGCGSLLLGHLAGATPNKITAWEVRGGVYDPASWPDHCWVPECYYCCSPVAFLVVEVAE